MFSIKSQMMPLPAYNPSVLSHIILNKVQIICSSTRHHPVWPLPWSFSSQCPTYHFSSSNPLEPPSFRKPSPASGSQLKSHPHRGPSQHISPNTKQKPSMQAPACSCREICLKALFYFVTPSAFSPLRSALNQKIHSMKTETLSEHHGRLSHSIKQVHSTHELQKVLISKYYVVLQNKYSTVYTENPI